MHESIYVHVYIINIKERDLENARSGVINSGVRVTIECVCACLYV